MKMTKEVEAKFFEDFVELMNKYHGVVNSFYTYNRRRDNVFIHLYYHRDFLDETPVKIVSTPDHKIVRGCDGGGYLEVKVHE